MRSRWLAILLLAITAFALAGCASSRDRRYGYGQSGRYGSVYGDRNRDYRWEQRERERERWRRAERQRERRMERHRDRDRRQDGRRGDDWRRR